MRQPPTPLASQQPPPLPGGHGLQVRAPRPVLAPVPVPAPAPRGLGYLAAVLAMAALAGVAVLSLAGGAPVLAHETRETANANLEELRLPHGSFAAGLNLGGLTLREARAELSAFVVPVVAQPILLRFGPRTWSLSPPEAGIRPDLERILAELRAVAQEAAGSPASPVASQSAPQPTARPDSQAATGGSAPGAPERRRAFSLTRASSAGRSIPLYLTVDEERLHAALASVAKEIERPPRPARLLLSGGEAEVIPAIDGREVDLAALASRVIERAVQLQWRTAEIPVQIIPARPQTQEVARVAARWLLATFSTAFDPADAGRTANIHLAAAALDLTVLAPGQTFSFNQAVGPRIAEAGYQEAPVLLNGELVPGIGGGVCQVSTTLYNAVLLAGLTVTRRSPHSVPVAYVPLGRDATVVDGSIDFRFVNSTGGHVLIDTTVVGNRLVVRLYGSVRPRSTFRLESAVDEVIPAPVQRVPDPTLPEGKERLEKPGLNGYRARLWRIEEVGGQEVSRELVARSYYAPHPRVVRVGTGSPPDSPLPSPAPASAPDSGRDAAKAQQR